MASRSSCLGWRKRRCPSPRELTGRLRYPHPSVKILSRTGNTDTSSQAKFSFRHRGHRTGGLHSGKLRLHVSPSRENTIPSLLAMPTPIRAPPHSEELLVKAYTTQEYPPRPIPRNRGDSVTSSASRRGPPAQQKPSGRPARRGHVTVVGGGQHVACYCPQCLAAAGLSKLDGKRTPNWHQSSPYLEDLTKSLVISQPARRKVHLVPPRRAHAAASPYETSLPTRAAPKLRTQLQVRGALALPSGPQCRPSRLPPPARITHALP